MRLRGGGGLKRGETINFDTLEPVDMGMGSVEDSEIATHHAGHMSTIAHCQELATVGNVMHNTPPAFGAARHWAKPSFLRVDLPAPHFHSLSLSLSLSLFLLSSLSRTTKKQQNFLSLTHAQ